MYRLHHSTPHAKREHDAAHLEGFRTIVNRETLQNTHMSEQHKSEPFWINRQKDTQAERKISYLSDQSLVTDFWICDVCFCLRFAKFCIYSISSIRLFPLAIYLIMQSCCSGYCCREDVFINPDLNVLIILDAFCFPCAMCKFKMYETNEHIVRLVHLEFLIFTQHAS